MAVSIPSIAEIPDLVERMGRAVQAVEERLLRSTGALEAAGIPYAVVGGNAVAAWVASIDEGAVRNTKDVDIAIRREDLPAVIRTLESVGFEYAQVTGVDLFIDGPQGKPSQGVHLLYFGERLKETDPVPVPEPTEALAGSRFRIMSLEGLVRMKLVANREKDRVHVRDMVAVGLIDASWVDRYPAPLSDRLRHVLETPDE